MPAWIPCQSLHCYLKPVIFIQGHSRPVEPRVILQAPFSLEAEREVLYHYHWTFKYKVAITEISNGTVIATSVCYHCSPLHKRTAALELTRNHNIFPDYTKNLHGFSVPVSLSSIIPGVQVRTINQKVVPYKTGGQNLRFVLEAARHLNFTPLFFHSTGGGRTGMRLTDGSWNGVVGDVLAGNATIGCCPIISEDRYAVVASLTAIDYVSVVFLHLNARPTASLNFILLPFDNTLWDFLLVFSMVMLIDMNFLARILKSRKTPVFDEWRWSATAIALLGSFFNQGYPLVRKTIEAPLRVLIAHWSLFAIVVSTAYSSVLFKLYMNLPKEEVPTTFLELAASDYEIGMAFYGGALYKFFKDTPNGSPGAKIFERARRMKPPSCWKAAVKPNFACITFDLDVLFFINTKRHSERPSVSAEAKKYQMIDSIVIPKGSVLQGSLENVFRRLNSGGFWSYWLERTFEDLRSEALFKLDAKHGRQPLQKQEDHRSSSMKHLGGLVLGLEIAIVVSIIAFTAEFVTVLCKRFDSKATR